MKPLRLFRHKDFSIILTFKRDGVPVNISTWTIASSVRENPKSADSILNFTVEFVTDGTDGQVTLFATGSDIALIEADQGEYDVWAEIPGISPQLLLRGLVEIDDPITW